MQGRTNDTGAELEYLNERLATMQTEDGWPQKKIESIKDKIESLESELETESKTVPGFPGMN